MCLSKWGATGPTGLSGPIGATGSTGPTGPTGLSVTNIRLTRDATTGTITGGSATMSDGSTVPITVS
jgi:hypothetical protein